MGSKAEETYKKIRQILSAAFLILNPDFQGDDEQVKIVEDHKKRVIQYEKQMLDAIKFEFAVLHIGQMIIRVGKSLSRILDKDTIRNAWKLSAKFYYTNLILQYPPILIVASIFVMECSEGEEEQKSKIIKWFQDEFHAEKSHVMQIIVEYNRIWNMIQRRLDNKNIHTN